MSCANNRRYSVQWLPGGGNISGGVRVPTARQYLGQCLHQRVTPSGHCATPTLVKPFKVSSHLQHKAFTKGPMAVRRKRFNINELIDKVGNCKRLRRSENNRNNSFNSECVSESNNASSLKTLYRCDLCVVHEFGSTDDLVSHLMSAHRGVVSIVKAPRTNNVSESQMDLNILAQMLHDVRMYHHENIGLGVKPPHRKNGVSQTENLNEAMQQKNSKIHSDNGFEQRSTQTFHTKVTVKNQSEESISCYSEISQMTSECTSLWENDYFQSLLNNNINMRK